MTLMNFFLPPTEIDILNKNYEDFMGKKFVSQNTLDTELPTDYSYNSMQFLYTCLNNINRIEKFTELWILDVCRSSKLGDISHIKFPNSLRVMKLWRVGVEKINLCGLNFKQLDLTANCLTDININFAVEKLDLSFNQIENLDFSNNENLVWCNLADNPLKSISFKGCFAVENISLENCGLHIAENMFDGCNNLQFLFLKGNYVDAATISALQKKFPNCKIFAAVGD